MPQVSIITPTYNRADMVGDAIQSVLDQTCADWELIIVDDGSKDNTADVVASYTDRRIKYIYQDNRKLPGARNTGLRAAQGQYIAFLDSDDLFLPNKLKGQAAILDSRPELGLVAGGFVEVDKELHALREMKPWEKQPTLELRDWLFNCPFCPGVPLIRRSWLDKVGLFDESMPYEEDWDLWLRLSQAGCRMDWLEESVCYYRIHGGNMVRHARLMKTGMLTMLDKLYAQTNLPEGIAALRSQVYANMYVDAAARAYAAGDANEGKACLGHAIRLNPALSTGSPPRVLDILASFALTPIAGDPNTFMKQVVNNLPDGSGIPRWSERKARGLIHAVAAFELSRRHEGLATARHTLLACLYDPRWLSNRGLFATAGRELLRATQRGIRVAAGNL